jgi:NAD(P)-dependent dehydrogenase (short-subunit alcohol dehydrogenase family)
MSIDFSVRGKHVLITGGTGGIGAAFAEAFTEAGANVTIVDIAPPRANQNSGLKYEHVDMCDDAAVAALGARTERMDVIIHCAGRAALDQEYSPIVFNQIVNLHLTGALRLANAFRPHLKASRGCIIQIASMTSYFAAPYAPAYGAAKTGIMSLTRTLAVEFAGDGIRVNAIAPGWIDTPLTKVVQEQMPEMNRRIVERLPSGRWNTPDELAGLAVFLASPAAGILTGVTIAADGGYSIT